MLAAAITGCSGSSSSSSSAHVRALNEIENGGSATVFINSGSANGSQNFEQSSDYLFLNGGASTFTFTLANFTSNAYPTVSHNLSSGQHYTAVTFGRADVGATDPRYPGLLVLDDNNSTITSGTSLVRIVNAAPDAGLLSVNSGSLILVSNVALGTNSGYVSLPSGSTTLSFTLASGSLANASVNLASGSAYTFVVDERTIPSSTVTASYGFVELADQ
jgi:hypothetical protein